MSDGKAGSTSRASHAVATAPIRRDGFAFNGEKFYTDPDGDYHHHHPRMEPSQLLYLLTYTPPPPSLTKKGEQTKRQAEPHKDQNAYFYTAQMVHYGLKPIKTKESAKKKLLAAFEEGGGTLTVPQTITELEASLRKEWQRADQARKRRAGVAPEEAKAGKRKREDAQHPSPRKKSPPGEKASKGTLKSDHNSNAAAKGKGKGKADPLRRRIEELSGQTAREVLLRVFESGASGQKLIKDALNNNPSAAPGKESKSGSSRLKRDDWMGIYAVRSKEIAEDLTGRDEDLEFEVYPSSTGGHLWASFHFGPIEGIIRSIGKPPFAFGKEVHFKWRGRETGEGMMIFSPTNRGILRFTERGVIMAEMDGETYCGKLSFSGSFNQRVLKKSAAEYKQAVRNWKQEWRGINQHNYDVEATERWGKWGGNRHDENAADSDTTGGHRTQGEESDYDMHIDSDDAY